MNENNQYQLQQNLECTQKLKRQIQTQQATEYKMHLQIINYNESKPKMHRQEAALEENSNLNESCKSRSDASY